MWKFDHLSWRWSKLKEVFTVYVYSCFEFDACTLSLVSGVFFEVIPNWVLTGAVDIRGFFRGIVRVIMRPYWHTPPRNTGCRYIVYYMTDKWRLELCIGCVLTHTHTHIHARAHTHIHTDYIDRSFFLLPLSLSRTNMHTRHKSLGLSVGWRKLDAKEAARRLKPQRFSIHWPIPADDTEKLFETLLTDQNWTIWVCADEAERPETQFRLKKGGADLGQSKKRPKMTDNLKQGLRRHGYVTDDMLRLAQENNE